MPYRHIALRFRLFGVLATVLALVGRAFGAGSPVLGNDDSCDLSVSPAATLLLPYFEVDLEDRNGETTLVTMTNVTEKPQVARVTLWTDLSYPVLTFNIYLTGYDVQSVNLYDVLAGGRIAPPAGTGTSISPTGENSGPNHLLDDSKCDLIPPLLDASMRTRMRQAFLTGNIDGVCTDIGMPHENAVGYATIDVVGNCETHGPTDPQYFTEDIRFDNVLIGDYQQLNPWLNFAQGSPMVHIRAIPAGGTPATRKVLHYPARFNRTFYGRFQNPNDSGADARQPLPSTFALRWINGGTSNFQTYLKIWRGGITNATANCAAYAQNLIKFNESVTFDEQGNGRGNVHFCVGYPSDLCKYVMTLPSTSLINVDEDEYLISMPYFDPPNGGWAYLNLDNDFFETGALETQQNWVVVSMRAEGRYSVDFDAIWLGNGCSPRILKTGYSEFSDSPPPNNPGPQAPGARLPGPAPDFNPPKP